MPDDRGEVWDAACKETREAREGRNEPISAEVIVARLQAEICGLTTRSKELEEALRNVLAAAEYVRMFLPPGAEGDEHLRCELAKARFLLNPGFIPRKSTDGH